MSTVEELYAKLHSDEAVLEFLSEKDDLSSEETELLDQLLMEEEAQFGYFEDD